MRIHAKNRPPMPAQASGRWRDSPPRTGPIEKAKVETDATRNPVQRSRSRRRPSTVKRIPARRATMIPARATAVWMTSRSSGRLQWV